MKQGEFILRMNAMIDRMTDEQKFMIAMLDFIEEEKLIRKFMKYMDGIDWDD